MDDGTRLLKVEGCNYRVTKEEIASWLGLCGGVKSVVMEDCCAICCIYSNIDGSRGVYS